VVSWMALLLAALALRRACLARTADSCCILVVRTLLLTACRLALSRFLCMLMIATRLFWMCSGRALDELGIIGWGALHIRIDAFA
jgi:hypothetical protein